MAHLILDLGARWAFLFVLLLIAKGFNHHISWWLVFAPVYVPVALALVLGVLYSVHAAKLKLTGRG